MKKNINEKIESITCNARGNIVDIYHTLYKECIENQDYASKALEIILQNIEELTAERDSSPISMDMDKVRRIQYRYKGLLSEIVRAIARQNLSVSEFYEKLYEHIFVSDFFERNDECHTVLLYTLGEFEQLIPYYQVENSDDMENDEYLEIQDKIFPCIVKAIHILNRCFETKTEETSQLMKIADSLKEPKDKLVFWSIIIATIKTGSRKRE